MLRSTRRCSLRLAFSALILAGGQTCFAKPFNWVYEEIAASTGSKVLKAYTLALHARQLTVLRTSKGRIAVFYHPVGQEHCTRTCDITVEFGNGDDENVKRVYAADQVAPNSNDIYESYRIHEADDFFQRLQQVEKVSVELGPKSPVLFEFDRLDVKRLQPTE